MDALLDLFERHGPLLVFFNVLAEQLGAPVPAVPALVVAGALSVQRHFSAATVVILAVLASGIANFAWYLAGRRHGRRILGVVCRITLSPDACVRGTEDIFGRWGVATLLVARFVPGVSSVAAPLAGATGMPVTRFLLFDTLGTSAWAATFVLAGVLFHRQAARVLSAIADLGGASFMVIAAMLASYVAFKWIERQRLLRFVRARRLEPAELRAMLESGRTPLVVDLRSDAAREADPRRIDGAMEIAMHELREALKDVPRDQDIVLLCACPNEASAAEAARALLRHGYRRVRPLAGGAQGWFDAAALR